MEVTGPDKDTMQPQALGEQDIGVTFYVATNGSDHWSGKLSAPHPEGTDGPFATLVRARDAIREIKKTQDGLKQPVTVQVRGGKYLLEQTFVLTQKDSGTQDCPITYAACPGEIPVISGGRRITDWKPYKDNILRCELPGAKGGKWKTRQLFCNGQRMIRARWPKYDPANPLHGGWATIDGPDEENPTCEFRYRPDTFPRRWAKPTEGEVNIWPFCGWFNNIIPIKAIDEDRLTINLGSELIYYDRPPWFINIEFQPGNRFYVENLLEELTTPGEWCLDSEEGILYFWPPDGKMGEAEVLVPILHCLMSLREVSFVSVSGFTFAETADGDDMHRAGLDGYGGMIPQQGRKYCGEALHMKGAQRCSVLNNRFCGLGGNAIYLEGRNYRNEVRWNEVSDVGVNGICLLGSRERHPQFNLVEDNDIHHCGVINKWAAGVFLGVCDGNVIGHNSIHDMPHHGINLGNNGYGRNIIEYNDIRRTVLEQFDSAAINCWGDVPGWTGIDRDAERSGHIIRYNYVTDTSGVQVDEKGNITLTDEQSRGIYLDDCSSNCVVYGNIIVNTGSGVLVHCGKHNVIENNIFINCRWQLNFCDWVSTRPGNAHLREFWIGNRFYRNICYLSRPQAELYHFRAPGDVFEHWDLLLSQADENLFHNPVDGQYPIGWMFVNPDLPSKPVCYEDWLKAGHDIHSILADPLFVDPEHGDYRLRPNSPAFKLGFQPIDMSRIGIRKSF